MIESMARVILQAIKLAPRLFFQSYFQPSKAYNFVKINKTNKFVFMWAIFFSGFLVSSVLASIHFYLYQNIAQSVLFAIIIAGAIACGAIGAFSGDSLGELLGGGIVAVLVAGLFATAGAYSSAVAGTGAFAGAFAFVVPGIGAFITILLTAIGAYLLPPAFCPILLFITGGLWIIASIIKERKAKFNDNIIPLYLFIFLFGWLSVIFSGGTGIHLIKPYEMITYPFAFMVTYSFGYTFDLFREQEKFEKAPHESRVRNVIETRQKFLKAQKLTLLWLPLITFLLFMMTLFIHLEPRLKTKIIIAAICFAVTPIFLLHIPDYLLCLFLWPFQRKKLLKKNNLTKNALDIYEKSILFKNEMLHFQLPGLHKIITAFAKNEAIGIDEAVKQINNLYLFTFQLEQAQKAFSGLLKDRNVTHQVILLLLEERSLSIMNILSKTNRLASLYMTFFERREETTLKKYQNTILIRFKKWFMARPPDIDLEKREFVSMVLADRINLVYCEMAKEKGYRFNNEMIKTLESIYKLLTSNSLKTICEAVEILEKITEFPKGINYFLVIESMVVQLKKIKGALLKIEDIERLETKRSSLSDQKEAFHTLTKVVEERLFNPFKHMWTETLNHCIELISQEIKLLQSSAKLSIELKNKEVLATDEVRKLYFEINNKGQELASKISVTLQVESPAISFPDGTKTDIDIIESGKSKEIFFSITPHVPAKTTLRGTLTFSDRVMEGKKLDFSFPVTILRKSAEFKKIKNPYIVSQPLKGNAPLFFGREDAHEFIDNNILAPGGHHTIVCHGLRRTGKTSLLYRIGTQGLTDKRLVPINIDMQGIDDEKDFYYTLSNAIIEEFSIKSASPVENFNRFKGFLKYIKPELVERIIVLMVDEFEELQMRVEEKKISKSVFSNIRHLMQHEEKLIFLFCGTHQLEEMSADYWSIFFNTAIYFRISHLKREDAIRLIKEPVKDQLTYDDLAVEQILKMTNGQPYLTQLICRILVNDLNENKKRNDALIDDVDDVVEHIINEGKEHFSQHIWDESSQLERLLLSAAAEELTQKQLDHVGPDAIFDKIKPLLPDFSRKQAMEALDKLVSKEILVERNLRYRFPVNLLRKWIAARYPLRKVREEI